MRDLPGVIDLLQAEGGPSPHALLLAVIAGALDVLEAVAESHVAADGDAQLCQLNGNLAVPGVQPPLKAGGVEHAGACFLQGWRQVELDDRTVEGGDELVGVFGAQGSQPGFQQRADLLLLGRRVIETHVVLPGWLAAISASSASSCARIPMARESGLSCPSR